MTDDPFVPQRLDCGEPKAREEPDAATIEELVHIWVRAHAARMEVRVGPPLMVNFYQPGDGKQPADALAILCKINPDKVVKALTKAAPMPRLPLRYLAMKRCWL